jgi:hypothetical protein
MTTDFFCANFSSVCLANAQPRSKSAASGAKALFGSAYGGGAESPPFRVPLVNMALDGGAFFFAELGESFAMLRKAR